MSAPAAPTFSPSLDAGETYASFDDSVSVTISGSGNIFYTLDESDPRINSVNQYSVPLVLTQNTKVKAVCVNSNTIGPVASQDFVLKS